jgi:hypothetical protein
MGQWRLTTREDGPARVMLMLAYGSRTLGVVNMSRGEYDSLCRFVMSNFVAMVGQELFDKVQQKLWQDAQRACREDAELAKQRLIDFGWSFDGIKSFAHQMTLHLAERLLGELPEYLR